ncbi:MAG: flagellar hook-associated protein FlgK [Clostridia bacterium]|nr:flagellar hook-associated protein FlgK [Clostridia bacterium]
MAIPTFQNLTTAYRALAASQTAISTVGHNISNANTEGYTRQRVDTASISSGSIAKYALNTKMPGWGVDVTDIEQIRDKFLDNRYRSENSDTSKYSTVVDGLGDLSNVFDEIENEGIQNQLIDLVNQLQTFSDTPTSADLALVARTSANQLTQMLNLYAEEVQDVREQLVYDLSNVVVSTDFNSVVQNIATLNKEIRDQQLYGNSPNELLDKRNLLIDELSSMANIKVTYNTEKVTEDLSLERLTISLYDADTGMNLGLVDGSNFNTLSVEDDGEKITIGMNCSFRLENEDGVPDIDTQDITHYFASGSIKGYIDLINGKGTYANIPEGENGFRGVAYYTESLNTFARTFAQTFNTLNDTDATDEDSMALFTTDDGETTEGITAMNIAISDRWLDDSTFITTTTSKETTGGNDNVLRMIEALSTEQNFESEDGTSMFSGTFSEYLTSVGGELALDSKLYGNFFKSSNTVLSDLYNSREETSGVSLDEEGVNLVAFQKAYQAAARYFTVLDEGLETLMSMGLVGR